MNKEPNSSLKLLQRLGPRGKDVCARYPHVEAIASIAVTFVPVADQFAASFGEVKAARVKASALLAASAEQAAQLARTMGAWTGALARDLAGFDPGAYSVRSGVVGDVISAAQDMIDVIESQGAELPYAEAALTALNARLSSASTAELAAQAARAELQTKQAARRELAVQLEQHLIALRPAVRAELGPGHVDYQRLRAARVRPEDDEVDEEATTAPPTVTAPTAAAVDGDVSNSVTASAK